MAGVLNDLLIERDRQKTIVKEAKLARVRITQLNKLIALYAQTASQNELKGLKLKDLEDEDVEDGELFRCTEPGCDKGFTRRQGLKMHVFRMHNTDTPQSYPCPAEGCDRVFAAPQGRGRHIAHAHKDLLDQTKEEERAAS